MFDAANVEDHVHLRCEVVGYQFPATADDDWCLVRVSVRQGQDMFERVDAALEAGELVSMRNWFRALSEDRLPRVARLEFTEPCLSFEFLARDENGVRFAVNLDAELRTLFLPWHHRARPEGRAAQARAIAVRTLVSWFGCERNGE